MPRKSRRDILEKELEKEERREEESLLEDDPKEAAEQLAVEQWLGDFQARFTDQPVKVLVEKFEEGEWAICRKYPLGSFDHESVRDEFGGGRYRATLYDPKGRYIVGGRNHFKFAAPASKKDPVAAPVNPLDNPVVTVMLQQMKSNSDMLLGLTQSMIAAQQGKPQEGLPQLIEAMVKMQTLQPKGEKPLDNFKETLGIMKLVKEVTSDGDGDSKGGFMSEVREFLELAPLLKEQLPALKASLSPGAKASPLPPVTPGGNPPMDPLTQKIIQLVPRFVGAAKAQLPVEVWAEYLLDALETDLMPVLLPHMKGIYGPLVCHEDDVYDILMRYAKDPSARDTIYKSVPPLSPYQAWCNAVIEAALKSLTEDPSGANVVVDAVSTPDNGNTPKPAAS